MFVVFVSHQWLATQQPDPTGYQMEVLRNVLRGVNLGQQLAQLDEMQGLLFNQHAFRFWDVLLCNVQFVSLRMVLRSCARETMFVNQVQFVCDA